MGNTTERTEIDRLRAENIALRAELEQRNRFFQDMSIGVWTVEKIAGQPPRMWGDPVMDEMVGVTGQNLTPEEYFNAWFNGIHPDDRDMLVNAVAEMDAGKRREVQYRVNHPTRGIIWIRCGARRDYSFTGGVRQIGRHQDVTKLVREEQQSIEVMSALGREYRTLWLVNKRTLVMRLIRTSEESIVTDNVAKALEIASYNAMHTWHVEKCVLAEDRERVAQATDSETVLREIARMPLYTVNYRRYDDGREIKHHQMAFADAGDCFVLAFRDIQAMVAQELEERRKDELLREALQRQRNVAAIERERDRALAAEKSKSLFFSSVSHDIRTPLNAILGFAELLEQGVVDPAEHDRYVSTIRSSGRMLARLVNDVLDLSKLESGRLELINEPTDIPAVAREIVESFGVTHSQKSVIFRTEIGEMPKVSIDPQRVRQILYNFLSNAFKYTDRGSITLRTKWDAGTLTLSVADTGRGISQEDLSRILQPFVQLADRNHRDGTGLGLSICQRLAKLMGGRLEVRSEPGKGSVFSVILENIREAGACKGQPRAVVVPFAAPAVPVVRRASRLLIVDDSKVNLAVLKAMLMKNGVTEVVTAENGRQALERLADDPGFDAVLTDFWMPEMDGRELVEAIRADANLAKLPVYLITADVEAVRKPEASGFTGVLLKPITGDVVRALLGSFS